MSFLQTIFGSSVDFKAEDAATRVKTECEENKNSEQHIKFLIDMCEEPQKMLANFHHVRQEFAGPEIESKLQKANDHRIEGNEHYLGGRYQEALSCYGEAIKLTPNDARLYSNSCLCQMSLENFEDAVVDAQSIIYADKSFVKGFGMMAAAYSCLGYSDIVASYIHHACNEYGPSYFHEANKKIVNLRKSGACLNHRTMGGHDLVATIKRLFQGNHPPRTYAFLLTHIVQHSEWDKNSDVESSLASVDFVRRALAVPYFKQFLTPNFNVNALSVIDSLNLCLFLRLVGCVLISNETSNVPPAIISFLSSMGQLWTKDETLRLFSKQTIPFGHTILEYFCRMLNTMATNSNAVSRVFRSTFPLNRPDWLMHLPVVCFGVLHPTRFADLYFAVLRTLCIISSKKWFEEILTKAPPAELSQAISMYASFGISCDRLLDYELPYGDAEIENGETYYMFWLKMLQCKEIVNLAIQIPEVWLMFARKLSKDTRDPSESGFALLALGHLLSPWAWEADDDEALKPVVHSCLEDGPWFDMFLYSVPRLMLPRKEYRDTVISAVLTGARFATASKKFAVQLLEKVPLKKADFFFNQSIDDEGAIHFLAVMLGIADDAKIIEFVEESAKRFDNVITHLMFSLTSADAELYSSMDDGDIYHACICFERLLKFALRIEATNLVLSRKVIAAVIDELRSVPRDLSKIFNDLVSWVKDQVGQSSSKGQHSGKGGRNKKRSKAPPRKAEPDSDDDEPIPPELKSHAVHKLFEIFSKTDKEMAKIVQQVKTKRRQF